MRVVVPHDPRAPRTAFDVCGLLRFRLPWGVVPIALVIREGWG